MGRLWGRRPSGSMVVAIAALVVSLAGTAVAASLVNGDKLIKKNSLSGSRLRNHSVTRKQLNLKKLGKVPNASHADSATSASHAASADTATSAGHAGSADTATSAGDAATVGHNTVVKVAVNVPTPGSGSTVTPLFTLDGLTITHKCMSSGNQDLTASTSKVGELKLVTVDEDTPGTHEFGVDKFDFTPADGTVDLYSGITDSQNVVGRLIWQTASGNVLTFEYQDETNSFGASNCTVGGMVLAG